MKRLLLSLVRLNLALLFSAFLCLPIQAAITVGGGLSDWGATGIGSVPTSIIPGDGGTSAWGVPMPGGSGGSFSTGSYSTYIDSGVVVRYAIEDSSDAASDGGHVGPHFGGQNYDAEFLGVAIAHGKLHIAIVSGQRPDNGLAKVAPGDIRIKTESDNGPTWYGVEVGGGAGDSTATQNAIAAGANGTTYNLAPNGFTISAAPPTDAMQTAGSLWRNPTWINDPILPYGPTQLQFDGSQGEFVDTLDDYYFSRDQVTAQHSIIELSIPYNTSVFSAPGERLMQVEWRPSCGNDELIVGYPNSSGPEELPEPTSIVLWGLLGTLIAVGKCRKRFFASSR